MQVGGVLRLVEQTDGLLRDVQQRLRGERGG